MMRWLVNRSRRTLSAPSNTLATSPVEYAAVRYWLSPHSS